MADPISIAASIVGLIHISAKIIRVSNQLYTSAKDVPTSISYIRDEMQQMQLIFLNMERLIEGYEKKIKRHKCTMLPLHDLFTVLTGCALAYSSLDKKLSEVAGLADDGCNLEVDPVTHRGQGGTMARSLVMRIKWALWKESEAAEIIANMQNHKLSLTVMLIIIQSDVASDDANRLAEILDNLRFSIEKISDQIAETHGETATQLRQLVSKHHDGSFILASPENSNNDASTTNSTFPASSISISGSTSHCPDITTPTTIVALRCTKSRFKIEVLSSQAKRIFVFLFEVFSVFRFCFCFFA